MKIYERYLARQIYLAFLFIVITFVGLFVFFDLISELSHVGHSGYKFHHALVHVLFFSPQRLYEIIPVSSLIAAIYVCAQMSGSSEFTILRISGISSTQALRSLLKIGIPLVIITFLIGELVAPHGEVLAKKIRLKALGKAISSDFRSGIWVKDSFEQDQKRVTRFINIGTLNADSTINNVRIYEFDNDFRLESIRFTAKGRFEPPNIWCLYDVSETRFETRKEKRRMTHDNALQDIIESSQHHINDFRMESELTPQILSVLMIHPHNMAICNLYKYIGHLKDNQQNTDRYILALWRKLLYPFASFVMMALALPFAYMHARAGAIGLKVFGGIMLGVSFQLLNSLFSHLGLLNTWPAWLTAALPGFLYLMLAIGALRWVEKH
ncbi:LPS export ABC transporter permease LptG [Candidatus Pandoraea novymonadis]|uniref:Lipopolysaccharide export system permease protein LptG n=1 Tax=Candidatus Pandoraea novymonadis TaxID=1808959 RepID=A0ABX5FF06_9BURK|nr:LPS export ABC transporter permease LptG [Candidatus Pandoraea novymonadis]PSB92249.1 Lipopolysaccharide export system permease protein LptG [Candidatus Pandoraea novymonadis]